jgi:hypothetical protein
MNYSSFEPTPKTKEEKEEEEMEQRKQEERQVNIQEFFKNDELLKLKGDYLDIISYYYYWDSKDNQIYKIHFSDLNELIIEINNNPRIIELNHLRL